MSKSCARFLARPNLFGVYNTSGRFEKVNIGGLLHPSIYGPEYMRR